MTAVGATSNQDLLADFLSEVELAQLLKRNVRTLRRWNVTRKGPPRIVVGRTILYRKSSVVAWLASHEQHLKRPR